MFTIHNLSYQGLYPAETFAAPPAVARFFGVQGLEFYGKVNFMKAGIRLR